VEVSKIFREGVFLVLFSLFLSGDLLGELLFFGFLPCQLLLEPDKLF